ncbi:CRISPR-associated endonuclease Cas1 [Spirulina subsalsa FACHB-351]|uniref:CRISPR-associated endonuclease Cas1 n=1 Tax=Spirulina subsalsa FACHB-351 TaxID=234711 RepID=A0ABT3LBG9_9CYAN|nr:CRISPR-associated endonuclease Cas1 [Spirulina subsalsa]MCW6038822.1 CRISPR-associated endonuclease Cas1 [Spirulina subsalsa FACHB-351]
MSSLYVSQQGCYIALQQEQLLVKRNNEILTQVQLPHLEQVLIFGKSQITTQAIRACLWRDIPIVYLSRMGYCYGRIIAIERGYRALTRYQQELGLGERLGVAQNIVLAKLNNSRTLLMRQQRRHFSPSLTLAIESLEYLQKQVKGADSQERLLGFEGAGAASYFAALGDCLRNRDFVFTARSRRPPGNPVNALLSFGYQVLWNHLLALIEVQGLDPYQACLHSSSERHAALASDLIEEFRAPLVDSLVVYLINRYLLEVNEDFEYRQGGCFLNHQGRRKFLQSFVQRMEESVTLKNGTVEPKWGLLSFQVKAFKEFVYHPGGGYSPYLID